MIQGTCSGAGKSTIAAALCRILKNKGYSVCPYKSQNMSLNSYITLDGKEMGRAQVLQAECAGIEPEAFMNPILLKPQGDRKSQIIFMGKVYGTMSAKEYEEKKTGFKKMLLEEFKKIDERFDAIVIEGAGSPAEINLRTNDIVNMGFAEMVDAPVILAGDIDKGGVFASLYGTVMLLKEEERKRIKGFIINKFRGDISILQPGIEMMEEKIGIPCLGVIPYFKLELEDEDGAVDLNKSINGKIDIAVIKLPHISNFTDVLPLEMEKDVSVRYIETLSEFKNPDLLIIPGTKNTIGDLEYLKEKGIYEKIREYRKSGGRILGICGGYQMLLDKITDPEGTEGDTEETEGLSLLNGETEITSDKVMTRTEGILEAGGNEYRVYGYEIHMGRTKTSEKSFVRCEGSLDGAVSEDMKVMGTYLHGILDGVPFREYLTNILRKEKGLPEEESPDFEKTKDAAMEELADITEKSLNMDKIMEILKSGGK